MKKRRRWLERGLILAVAIVVFSAAQAARGAPSAPAGEDEDQVYIIDIGSSPALPGVLIASLAQGPWRSTLPPRYSFDGGVSWRELPPAKWTGGQYMHVAVAPRPDPASPVRFIVGAGGYEGTNAWEPTLGVYRTGDRGNTWRSDAFHRGIDPCIWHQYVQYLFIDSPADRPTLYATYTNWVISGCEGGDVGYSFGGLIKSGDYGATWSRFTAAVDSILPSPVLSDTLYGLTDSARLRSDDGGATWQPTGIPTDGNLALDAQDPNLMYLVSETSWRRSRDGGATWAALPQPPCPARHENLWQYRVDSSVGGMILLNCAEPSGMYRSGDAGATWQRIGAELDGLAFALMEDDHGHPGRLLRVASDNELWASDDHAATWFRLHVFQPFPRIYLPFLAAR